jgi:predicted O-methyltransferase YrrM
MPNTLREPAVESTLRQLFEQAALDDSRRPRVITDNDRTAQGRAEALSEVYMPVSPEGGRLLYSLVRSARPATVVEFGMSFGISTLFLAAAVRDNGTGHVYTTELSADKIAAAKATFARTGLDTAISVLEGDARDTLAGLDGTIDLVLLDGWKDLYLPVLHLLEPRLRPGALVIADDSDFSTVAPYLAYIRDPASGYENVAFPVGDGMEVSCRV